MNKTLSFSFSTAYHSFPCITSNERQREKREERGKREKDFAMGGEASFNVVPQPTSSPLNLVREDQHWRHFDNSLNAVSFGFVATAILISMFLAMAIFERFLRPRSSSPSSGGRNHEDLEAHMIFNGKLDYPSPKMTFYQRGVSVLMPGEKFPTFIAHPAPAPAPAPEPCPPERVSWPLHQHYPCFNPSFMPESSRS